MSRASIVADIPEQAVSSRLEDAQDFGPLLQELGRPPADPQPTQGTPCSFQGLAVLKEKYPRAASEAATLPESVADDRLDDPPRQLRMPAQLIDDVQLAPNTRPRNHRRDFTA